MKKQNTMQQEQDIPLEDMFGPHLDMKNYMKQGAERKENQTLANGINALVASYAMTQKIMDEYGIKDPRVKGIINTGIGKGYFGLAQQLGQDKKYSVAATMYGMLAGIYLDTGKAQLGYAKKPETAYRQTAHPQA